MQNTRRIVRVVYAVQTLTRCGLLGAMLAPATPSMATLHVVSLTVYAVIEVAMTMFAGAAYNVAAARIVYSKDPEVARLLSAIRQKRNWRGWLSIFLSAAVVGVAVWSASTATALVVIAANAAKWGVVEAGRAAVTMCAEIADNEAEDPQ